MIEHQNLRLLFKPKKSSWFLSALSDDFRANPEAWENNSLSSFIEALAAYAQDIYGYYKNFNLPVDASVPSWRVFAEILCGARIYE